MRVIVFDRELHEPLTVANLPMWLFEMGKTGNPIALAPQRPLKSSPYPIANEIEDVEVCLLRLQRVRHGHSDNVLFWYAYAEDPELALLLRCAYLPGQIGDVQRRERAAFFKGVLASFT